MPLEVHTSIGVLGAVTVATALLMDGAAGHELAAFPAPGVPMSIEHPTGRLDVQVELDTTTAQPTIRRSSTVRTARRLFDGTVFARPPLSSPGAGHDHQA
ncbi:PrpF domain-containing protein [Actinoallomurus bryophytorum]|uniref:PrpF domain-containing protein n=1 Tax=Actinoallomurus bryophytorum TaxID=1490222 RepID=UPI003CCC828B